MSGKDLKLEELRLLFDRENSRKQNLENKASYFLGCISIVVTIVATFLNNINVNNLMGLALFCSFFISIGFCISVIIPKKYYHPFELDDFDKLKDDFNRVDDEFEKMLFNQYLIAIYMNYDEINDIARKIKYSVFYFIWFLVIFIVMVVFL